MAAPSAWAQAPAWQSALAIAGMSGVLSGPTVTALAPDAAGSVYVAGTFAGTVTLGSTTLVSAGAIDVFVAKWNPAANTFSWAQRLGGSSNEAALDLAVSGSSVYVSGSFNSPTVQVGTTTLTNESPILDFNGYVVKLTDAGSSASFAWAVQVRGSGYSQVQGLAAAGNAVYLTGYGGGSIIFGPTTPPDAGGSDIFVAKLTDAGSSASFAWVVRAGGAGNEQGFRVAVAGSTLYVAGAFNSAALPLGNTVLASAGDYDGFVTKLTDASSSASFNWAQRVGGPEGEGFVALATANSAVYAAGGFTSATVAVGSTTLVNTGQHNEDLLVVKLTDQGSTGTLTWGLSAGGSAGDFPTRLVQSGGAVYAVGLYGDGNGPGGTAAFGTTTLPPVTSQGAFVAKVADAGATATWAWAQAGATASRGIANAVAVSGTRLCVGGGFAGSSATFGAFTLAASPAGGGFLASISDPALPTRAATALPDLALFPNPAHATATVRVLTGPGLAALTLCDALGRVVRTASAPTGQDYPFSLAGLAPGLYALRVQAGDAIATRSLVVE